MARYGSAIKSLFPVYTIVCEHFETDRGIEPWVLGHILGIGFLAKTSGDVILGKLVAGVGENLSGGAYFNKVSQMKIGRPLGYP